MVTLPFQTLKNEMTKLSGMQVSDAAVKEMQMQFDNILNGTCILAAENTKGMKKKRIAAVTIQSILRIWGVEKVADDFKQFRKRRQKSEAESDSE